MKRGPYASPLVIGRHADRAQPDTSGRPARVPRLHVT